MNSKTTIRVLIIAVVLLLTGIYYLINNDSKRYDILQRSLTEYEKATKDLNDKVSKLNASNLELQAKITDYENRLSDLSKIKKETITKYRDKQKLISTTGDLAVLDSLIRANSGLPQR